MLYVALSLVGGGKSGIPMSGEARSVLPEREWERNRSGGLFFAGKRATCLIKALETLSVCKRGRTGQLRGKEHSSD